MGSNLGLPHHLGVLSLVTFHSATKGWEVFLRLKSRWAFESKGVGSALSGK